MDESLDRAGARGPRPEVRCAQRVFLHGEVVLRRAGYNAYRVHIYDVSPQGCKVEFVLRPELEETVWVKFQGLEALEATVRWTRARHAGLKFSRPIHPAVFDLLLRRLKRQTD